MISGRCLRFAILAVLLLACSDAMVNESPRDSKRIWLARINYSGTQLSKCIEKAVLLTSGAEQMYLQCKASHGQVLIKEIAKAKESGASDNEIEAVLSRTARRHLAEIEEISK